MLSDFVTGPLNFGRSGYFSYYKLASIFKLVLLSLLTGADQLNGAAIGC